MAFEFNSGRRGFVAEGHLGNHVAREFAGKRMPGKDALGGVSEGLARTVDSSAIGRDEAVAAGNARSCGEAGDAGCSDDTGGDELAARDVAHRRSGDTFTRPVIMARMRLQNPVRAIIAT